MIQLLRDLWRKRGGTASIEFAFALPVLLVMFMGVFEVSQALIMYMKVIDVADTVSDLVSQQRQITTTDIDNYLAAGQLVMTPSPGNGLGLAIASVIFDGTTGNPSVAWQVTEGGAAAMTAADLQTAVAPIGTALGSGACNPTAANPCNSVIVAQASYTYNSALSYLIQHPIAMSARVFSRPRAVFVIPCTPSPCTN
jgi:Flp pilus assembly protein TadG